MASIRIFLPLILAAVLAACAAPDHLALTSELRRDAGHSRILLMPVDIELSELTAGGMLEPKADWTEEAKQYLTAALREKQVERQIDVVDYAEDRIPLERRDEIHQVVKLYAAVGKEIELHQYKGPLQLPTKAGGFNWSVGPEVRALRDQFGADYALLTYVRDSYASDGRKAVMLLAAIANVQMSGGVQEAFISLVDLNTGDIVWYDRRIIGRTMISRADMREPGGAKAVAASMLESFPK